MLCSSQDQLRTGTRDLDYHVLVGVENTDSWRTRKGNLQHAFHLDVLMVPSTMINVTANGEHLTCGGFSLNEPVRLRNFQFITDYFDDLSLSPRGELRYCLHGLNSPWGIYSMMGHDRGLCRGVPHNHTTNGECSGRSGHDDGSLTDGGATGGSRPPF
jgi:hypothetical protein